MTYKTIQPGKTFLFLILLFVLGYTHLLGGPYWLARFLFVTILIGVIIFVLFIWKMLNLAKKITKNIPNNHSIGENPNETIKVESKVVE